MTAAWSIAYGHEEAHASALKLGIATLPVGFLASVCELCGGTGNRRQMFTAGCGSGYYHAMRGCDYCDGTGLLQGTVPAPASVRAQVLTAAGV
jgi:hypothetical protein